MLSQYRLSAPMWRKLNTLCFKQELTALQSLRAGARCRQLALWGVWRARRISHGGAESAATQRPACDADGVYVGHCSNSSETGSRSLAGNSDEMPWHVRGTAHSALDEIVKQADIHTRTTPTIGAQPASSRLGLWVRPMKQRHRFRTTALIADASPGRPREHECSVFKVALLSILL